MRTSTIIVALAFNCLSTAAIHAQSVNLSKLKIEQRLDHQLPLETMFVDENNRTVTLGEAMNNKPTILMMGYFDCPMLCDPMLEDLPNTLNAVPYSIGDSYGFMMMSISPDETAHAAQRRHRAFVGALKSNDDASRSHVRMLRGSPEAIDTLVTATGYGYAYDAQTRQYAHPAALIILTADGRISRYLLGMKFNSRDIKLALLDATNGEIGSATDGVLLQCYQYDPATGKYGFAVMTTLRIAGIGTVVVIAGLITILSFHSRKRADAEKSAIDAP